MKTSPSTKPLLWIDLEMTGLDEKVDHILEIAIVITDQELKTLDTYHRVVFQPAEVIEGMNEWCKKNHGASGLTALIPTGMPLAQVEDEVMALIQKHFKTDERIVMAGNSVGNDRRFVDKYLLKFAAKLHYRLVDVSSFKEVFRERYGLKFDKKNAHRAIDDIYESIKELEYYLSFIKIPEEPAK